MLQKIVLFTNKYKIVRGIISYAALWPCGCLIEQYFVEKKTFKNFDWNRCLKFSIFGALYMGPTMYIWVRLAAAMWPRTDIKSSFCKALTEQVSYDPMMICTFLFGMSLMEGKTTEEAQNELSSKFMSAYRVGVIYWPIVQTFNFTFIPAKNQVVFTSIFSMFWTSFLAYMKSLDLYSPIDLEHHFTDIHFLDF